MAKITKVRVSIGYTKNAGNYESARVEGSMEAELTEGDSSSEVMNSMRDFLKEKVHNDAVKQVEYMKSMRG